MSALMICEGTVMSQEGSIVKVQVVSSSACSSCAIKSSCMSSDTKHKIVEVKALEESYNKGEVVTLFAQRNLGNKAAFIAYFMPLLLIIAVLLTMQTLFHNELLSALISLFVLVPYYGVIYLLRERIAPRFQFHIHKQQ